MVLVLSFSYHVEIFLMEGNKPLTVLGTKKIPSFQQPCVKHSDAELEVLLTKISDHLTELHISNEIPALDAEYPSRDALFT